MGIDWALSLDGDPAKLEHWPPDHVPRIAPGQVIYVRVAAHNVGDRASEAALTNFVAPACLDVRWYTDLQAKPAFSGSPTAGLPPDYRVVYFAPRLEPWTPGNSYLYLYRLTHPTNDQRQPRRIRLLFDIADSRFNRTGRRWLPSLLTPELGHAQPGERWPPRSQP